MYKHFVRIVVAVIIAVVVMSYPFFPGGYDVLAVPLSTMVQLFGVAGLLIVPIGVAWLVHEVWKWRRRKQNRPYRDRGYHFALASLIVASVLATLVSLFILIGISVSLGILALVLWILTASRLTPKLKILKNAEYDKFNPAPMYLVFIPLAMLFCQLTLAAPITEFSRNRAIANSSEFIGDIEAYHDEYGYYPASLSAMWKDYYPDIVGIEKFHYSQFGESYNLFFEQPRFLIDNVGTREWVVYNPNDEHRMFSHTAWFLLLTPEQLERSQGWYSVHDTSIPHWKYFWFD
jgi:hypothetical protein